MSLYRSARQSAKRIESLRDESEEATEKERLDVLEQEFITLADRCASAAQKTSYRLTWLSLGVVVAIILLLVQVAERLIT